MNSPQIGYISLPLEQPQKSIFEKILTVLDARMTTPTIFSWYHFLWFAIIIVFCALVVIKCRNLSERQVLRILAVTDAVLIILEIYKQFHAGYNCVEDVWDYSWSAFPFQFCSTPMYVILALVFIKNRTVKDALYCFLATYSLFAGIIVLCNPETVFTETVAVNVQTMIHHGAMIVLGVLLFVSGTVKLEHKTILRAIPVFGILATVAFFMNLTFDTFGNPDESFNMFFIAIGEGCPAEIVNDLFPNLPYPVYLCGYLLGFTLASYLVLLVAMACGKLHQKHLRPAELPAE